MDFRVRELDFQEADRRYAELTRQRDDGSISDEEFDAQRRQLMVQDDEGRRWAKIGKSGDWHYRDGGAWVRGTPPGYEEAAPEPTTGDEPPQTLSSPHPEDAGNEENERRKVPLWASNAAIGATALLGIALIIWLFASYGDKPASGKQGETMLIKQGESASGMQGNPAPADEATFDAVFVHRATPENVAANSTYLDTSLANGDPDAVLYVTPNWNPGGGVGTYNEHPIGVWYDDASQRWAIFNQDRETMPDGAAFNVTVLDAR